MYLTQKIKLRIDKSTEDFLTNCIDGQRFFYNQMLQTWLHELSNHRKVSHMDIIKDIRRRYKEKSLCDKDGVIYEDLSWIESLPLNLMESAREHLKRAFDTYYKKFKDKSYKGKTIKLPQYRSKKNSRKAFSIYRKTDSTFTYDKENQTLKFTKSPLIKLKETLKLYTDESEIKVITFSEEPYGWYVSITYSIDEHYLFKNDSGEKVGIDLGVKDFAILSRLDKQGNPYTINLEDLVNKNRMYYLYSKIKKMQKALSKKRIMNKSWKSSKRYEMLKSKIALAYARLTNIRNEFLHKTTTFLTMNFKHIAIETLKVSNLIKNKNLSKVIHESCFYKFKVLLKSKAVMYGCNVIEAPSNFPSTQTCSHCGYIKKGDEKLALKDRIYHCHSCGTSLYRDYNAALNLENLI